MWNRQNIKASISLTLIILMISVASYQYGLSTVPLVGPYYLDIPFADASFYVGKFDSGLTYMVDCDTWRNTWSSTDDAAIINACIGNLSSGRTEFETIVVRGDFTFSSTVTLANYVYLDLSDARITLANSANVDLFDGTNLDYIWVTGGYLDGNRANNAVAGCGFNLTFAGNQNYFEYVEVIDTRGSAFKFQDDSVHMYSCKGRSITLALELIAMEDSWITGCTFQGYTGDAYMENCISIMSTNTYFGGHSPTGQIANVLIDSCRNLHFLDCCVDYGSQCGYLIRKIASGQNPPRQITITGGRITKGSREANNTYTAIRVMNNTQQVLVSNVEFPFITGNTRYNYLFEEWNTTDYNLFESNLIGSDAYHTSPVLILGSNTQVSDNIGFVTENSGSVAAGGAGTPHTIAHGLAGTPTSIIVVPQADAGNFYVDTVGAANFNINWDGGGNIAFYWWCEYTP